MYLLLNNITPAYLVHGATAATDVAVNYGTTQ